MVWRISGKVPHLVVTTVPLSNRSELIDTNVLIRYTIYSLFRHINLLRVTSTKLSNRVFAHNLHVILANKYQSCFRKPIETSVMPHIFLWSK